MVAPVIIAAWAAFCIAIGLAYIFVIGAFAIALGFAVAGFVKLAKKKWIPGVACLMLCIATVLYMYGYLTGGV